MASRCGLYHFNLICPLEVAVRDQRTGIPAYALNSTGILDPGKETPVEIIVTVEADGFEVEQQVQTLLLPPTGNSQENACFRVRPQNVSATATTLSALYIRLYYEFNLLEVGVVQAEVIGPFSEDSLSQFGLANPISWRQQRKEQDYLDFENITPRHMHIDVTQQDGTYGLQFTLRNAQDKNPAKQLVLTGASRLKPADLESDLNALRDIWNDIATTSVFSSQLAGTLEDLRPNIRKLAQVGRALWVKLFKQDAQSALAVIGRYLEQHPLERDSIVQISLGADADDFIFPWALLYDRAVSAKEYELPDLEGFWGMRYCIEQQIPGARRAPDVPVEAQPQLNMAFMAWDQFTNSNLEVELMTSLVQQSKGRLNITLPPITSASGCYELLKTGDKDILYFYSHGYTRRRESNFLKEPNWKRVTTWYDSLPADSPLRVQWKSLYDSIQQSQTASPRSYIELVNGRLYLDELYQQFNKLGSQPLVILNMCESAQVMPSLQDSFIHFFLNRGARAVLGTECPMTIQFAHPFAEQFLRDILAGKPVGQALVRARRIFMGRNNPLGLAYTLYGSSTVRYQPSCLELQEEPPTQAAPTEAMPTGSPGQAH